MAKLSRRKVAATFDRPIFIVAAPRSGSTLLFETMSRCEALWTIGGEAHELFEGIPKLRVGSPGVGSNRLASCNADENTSDLLRSRFLDTVRNRAGRFYANSKVSKIRLLEKTPKNSLRIPFIDIVFPDALFIYLYRDARANISSIMEAWRAGGWITYRNLPGWDGPWSLLLPPNWRTVKGQSLVEVAAFQWKSANQHIIDDLENLPKNRWTSIDYADLVTNPSREIMRLCRFASLPFDPVLEKHTAGALPLSQYTHTSPSADKWKKNAADLEKVLPGLAGLETKIKLLVAQ